jgi:predicted polyphosphate/ATP-dependent NAD kinase
MLRALASDPEVLEKTYAEWLIFATKKIEELRKRGLLVRKIDVDVQELAAWCQSRDRVLNGEARAKFVTEKMLR